MSPRVLLTDADERYVLAATRGLGRAGFAVTAVSGRRPAAARWSRWCDRGGRVTDPHDDPERFVGDLSRILRESRHDVAVPGGEAALVAMSRHRARLEPSTRLGLPAHDVVLAAVDRAAVESLAAEVGLAAPAGVACHDLASAGAAAERLGFPVMVKPERSEIPIPGGTRHQSSVAVMEPADLPAAVAAAGPSFAVQQYTPDARVVSFAGVASRDGLLAVAFSRYERTWPPEAGSVTASVTAVPPPDLLASIEALLARIGWEGIFELELLEHPDGGRSVIDFNPRVYGSMTLAIDAGANLPAVWVQHVLGGKQAPIAARAGLRYRWEEGEARTAGRLVSEHRYAEAGRLLRTPSPRVWAFFRASDPMPAVVRASWLLARPLRRGLERIRSTGDEAARPPAPGDGASTATPSEPAPPCDGAGCERPRSLLLQRRAADGRLLEAGFCDRHTFDVAVQTAVFASRRTPGVEASGS